MNIWNERTSGRRARKKATEWPEFMTDKPEYDAGSLVSGEAMTISEAEAMANMDLDMVRDDNPLRPEFSDSPGPHTCGDARATLPDSEVPRGTMEDDGDAEA